MKKFCFSNVMILIFLVIFMILGDVARSAEKISVEKDIPYVAGEATPIPKHCLDDFYLKQYKLSSRNICGVILISRIYYV